MVWFLQVLLLLVLTESLSHSLCDKWDCMLTGENWFCCNVKGNSSLWQCCQKHETKYYIHLHTPFFFLGQMLGFTLLHDQGAALGCTVFSKCHKIENSCSFKRVISWCKAQSWLGLGSIGLLKTYEKGAAMPLLPDTLYSFGGFILSVFCVSSLVSLTSSLSLIFIFSFLSL